MNFAKMTLLTRDVEPGWSLIEDDVPLGKEYVVDMDRIDSIQIVNRETGQTKSCAAVYVISPTPGYLPCFIFGMVDFAQRPGVTHQPLSMARVELVCRVRGGVKCCTYLCQHDAVFFCAKGTEYESMLRQRRANGRMASQGDNCSGPPDFKVP